MLHSIFIKCLVDVVYFIFIFDFALRSKILSENVRKPIKKKIKGLNKTETYYIGLFLDIILYLLTFK